MGELLQETSEASSTKVPKSNSKRWSDYQARLEENGGKTDGERLRETESLLHTMQHSSQLREDGRRQDSHELSELAESHESGRQMDRQLDQDCYNCKFIICLEVLV